LDTYKNLGFLAIAMVQTAALRPAFMPEVLGQDFFLSGYRIFTRLESESNSIRGLRILRSDTDNSFMALSGNLLTHYNYQRSEVVFREGGGELHVEITTPDNAADLEVTADISHKPAVLPAGTPFETEKDARKFAGPLPYTFDYEKQTNSIIMIRGIREDWNPEPVSVNVKKCSFFKQAPFTQVTPILANAFHLQNVPYRWNRGERRPLQPK
jgi:hypothetical protein